MARRRNPKQFRKALGLKIRGLRNDRGWTLEATEEHGWKNWTHLQRIEAGKNITLDTLVHIANLFEIQPSKLLEDV